jgi:hypothetical protein
MSAEATTAEIQSVMDWYEKFHASNLDGVVAPFTDNAILTIGAAESESYLPYGGRFVGKAQIKRYYAGRFMRPEGNPTQVIRPLCGLKPFMQQFGRWILVGGTIKDTQVGGKVVYEGKYLHVWSVNPEDGKFASMSMFFDPAHVANN